MLNTVAVGTDGSRTAAKALDLAIDLAQRYGARLVDQLLPTGERGPAA